MVKRAGTPIPTRIVLKQSTVYVTTDQKQFTSEDAAKAHQAVLVFDKLFGLRVEAEDFGKHYEALVEALYDAGAFPSWLGKQSDF